MEAYGILTRIIRGESRKQIELTHRRPPRNRFDASNKNLYERDAKEVVVKGRLNLRGIKIWMVIHARSCRIVWVFM